MDYLFVAICAVVTFSPLVMAALCFMRPESLVLHRSFQGGEFVYAFRSGAILGTLALLTFFSMGVVGYVGAGRLFAWLEEYPLDLPWLKVALQWAAFFGVPICYGETLIQTATQRAELERTLERERRENEYLNK
jgi:hypothetical protein